MLSDFFDTMGTVIGIAGEAGLLDKDGKLPGIQKVLIVDSLGAAAGGAASASSNTTYIESVAIPYTYSITNGVGAGFIAYTVIAILRGKGREVHWLMYLVAAVFGWYFFHGVVG